MATRRNRNRKNRASRRNRNRKNRNSRRNRRNNMMSNNMMMGGRAGLFGTLYSPVSHLLQATGNSVGAVTNTTRNVSRRALGGVDKIGRSVTGHANLAVRNLVSRRRRGSRRNRRN